MAESMQISTGEFGRVLKCQWPMRAVPHFCRAMMGRQ
jgi:hypothetical protein